MSRSAGPSSPVSAASRASKASRSSPRPRSSMSPTGLRHDAADCPGLMAGADHKARRGRPREFCTQEALATAMRLFWAKGFGGTSVSDLAGAMGISKPSLYAAFGDKEALFAKALRLYTLEEMAFVDVDLEKPSPRMVAENLVHNVLVMSCK